LLDENILIAYIKRALFSEREKKKGVVEEAGLVITL
jgi:hypothetical protein